jgi:hypothetical protein
MSGGTGLDPEMLRCLARRVRAATFSPPNGSSPSFVVIPIQFALTK